MEITDSVLLQKIDIKTPPTKLLEIIIFVSAFYSCCWSPSCANPQDATPSHPELFFMWIIVCLCSFSKNLPVLVKAGFLFFFFLFNLCPQGVVNVLSKSAACLSSDRRTACKIINKRKKRREKQRVKLLTCKFHDFCMSRLLLPLAPPSAIIHHAVTSWARKREQLLGVSVCVLGTPKKLLICIKRCHSCIVLTKIDSPWIAWIVAPI